MNTSNRSPDPPSDACHAGGRTSPPAEATDTLPDPSATARVLVATAPEPTRTPGFAFALGGARLRALPSGALHWPEAGLLAVADLHLGKAERMARRGGALLPPYETRDTLLRLEADIDATRPARVVCLGDSFDDAAAASALEEEAVLRLARLMAGRQWDWIAGNHDPGPLELAGTHRAELALGPLVFRHIAVPGAAGEVSGHYHPKVRLSLRGARLSRPCFLIDAARVILPAYGTYTGGLATAAEALSGLMAAEALAVLTGARAQPLPMPRGGKAAKGGAT